MDALVTELAWLVNNLPDGLWASVTSLDGLPIAAYTIQNALLDKDQVMTGVASLPLIGSSICGQYYTGEFRYAVIGGKQVVYVMIINEVSLTFCLKKFIPIEHVFAVISGSTLYQTLKN